MSNFSFLIFVVHRNDIWSMSCHKCFHFFPIGVDVLDIPLLVFLPNCPPIRIWTNLSMRCFIRNSHHMVRIEMAILVVSNFLGDFVFSHLEDVSMTCLHIDLAYAFPSI